MTWINWIDQGVLATLDTRPIYLAIEPVIRTLESGCRVMETGNGRTLKKGNPLI
jgi:hypothetical protein